MQGVVPGKYAVMTVRSGPGFDNQPKVYCDPVPFEVTDGDVSDVEIKAHRGLIVSGTVVTDAITNRAALAGVSRLIVASFNSPPPGSIQTSAGSGNSAIGPDGSFQLEGLRPGKLSFNIGAVSAGESSGYSILRMTAGERELPNRQLELSQGQNVSGVRVYLQYGTGVVKDESNDLFAKIPHGDGQTIFREALLLADHNACHLGQLMMLRRMLNSVSDG